MDKYVRVPFEPISKHIPPNATRILGTNTVVMNRVKERGLTIDTAKRWTQKLGLDYTELWPELKSDSYKFWGKVKRTDNPDECWEWKGYTEKGYGLVFYNGKKMWAHRLALILSGFPDQHELLACHSCDNPSCCNPNHLRFDTHQSNTHDAVSRNRHAWGERNGHSRLTENDVIDIRTRYQAGTPAGILAKEFGVGNGYIGDIVVGRKRKLDGGPISSSPHRKKRIKKNHEQ